MVKAVSFKEDEQDLIQHLKINGYDKAFSYYVKILIKKDMNNGLEIPKSSKETEKPHKPKRNANYDFK